MFFWCCRDIHLSRWTLGTSGHTSFTLKSTHVLPGSDSGRRYIYSTDIITKHITKIQECIFWCCRDIHLSRWTLGTSGHTSFTLKSTPVLPGSDSVRRYIYNMYIIKKHIWKIQECIFWCCRDIHLPRWTLGTSGPSSFILKSTPALPGFDSVRRYIYNMYIIKKHIWKIQECVFWCCRDIHLPRCALGTTGHTSFTLKSTHVLPGSDSGQR